MRKCENSPLGQDEMKLILGRRDVMDHQAKSERLTLSNKRTWLRMILEEIVANDICGQFCEVMTLGHLWVNLF